ncbi:Bug family tripartite tricarboxylate transporter substrate binding protein [Variovorax terrae]|uniref:Tripartite tricarboxylate transporter substrate binding protein n=1 Tax=Variovorax terrae TaxID=2923278 RepID=A0A9X1VS57_9BURK|nr:tripartite tricarboxylate transporter substrate binding protein [Variovorax terrae]MCJ0762357.1 tripartite tricarboxylate transporter substrate binding protein [Variovorax terrae]
MNNGKHHMRRVESWLSFELTRKKIVMKKLFRLVSILLLVAATGIANVAAQEFPTRPVTLIVPYGPGGPVDGQARLIAEYLSTLWKQPVIVSNKAGGGGLVGVVAMAHATPDGHTLAITGAAIAAFKSLMKNPGLDVDRDLAPISLVGIAPVVIAVSSQTPVKSLTEFISYAKARPGKLSYGSSSASNTLTIEAFNQLTGIQMVGIPYSGEAQNSLALSRGDVQLSFLTLNAAVPMMQAGKVRALSLTSESGRWPGLPDVPAAREAGLPGMDLPTQLGVFAPAGTPMEIRRKIARDIARFVAEPDMTPRLFRLGLQPVSNTPEEFTEQIKQLGVKFSQVAQKAKIQPE